MATFPQRIAKLMPCLQAAHLCYGVDIATLAAILDQESMGGNALAPDGTGDEGMGCGLFQVDRRFHKGFCEATRDDGVPLWKLAPFNTLYAADILARNMLHSGADELIAIAAYNCGLSRAKMAVELLSPSAGAHDRIAALDSKTTNGNYLSSVLRRRAVFLSEQKASV